jgi:hypothetical protein
MMASAVFAPVAMAQEPAEVDLQSVTLGPGGSVTVNGTIQCTEGWYWQVTLDVRQARGIANPYVRGGGAASGWCQTTGPTAFTIVVFAESPFRRGEVTMMGDGTLFDTQTGANFWTQFGPEEFWLR